MRILILNASDISGGAARAAYRLHRSLLSQGVESIMLVQKKDSDDNSVVGPISKIEKGINIIRPHIDSLLLRKYKNRTKTLFSPSSLSFSKTVEKINQINPDIVHMHWINGAMFSIEELTKIKFPLVWSLHDMWAFTGGCHYDEECGRFVNECGKCKVLGSRKEEDLSKKIFHRKVKVYSSITDLTVVGLSKWLNNSSKKSTLLKNKRHVNLPNPIDTNTFKPFDKQKARELWCLPKNKKLVLFGAIYATSDERKGYNILSNALTKLNYKDIQFIVFGSSGPSNQGDAITNIHYLGKLNDDISLITLYSAADVMVVPSLQENLSNTIMESMACGTPVVGFDIGGNGDLIDHKKNGYLAKYLNSDDLTKGISWVLSEMDNHNNLSIKAREKIVLNFDSDIVAKQYINLYKSILA
ncbi:MAG: glycosyltransferase [Gammaproteobacteria bacterium]|jgi:glycosyltransferase involved in cell wall biosynthesis|nr:glycosyltransferase [Gammaproteobacteria bacterium]